jgi:hypothetical protein
MQELEVGVAITATQVARKNVVALHHISWLEIESTDSAPSLLLAEQKSYPRIGQGMVP